VRPKPTVPSKPASTLLPTLEAVEVSLTDVCAEGVRRVTIHAQLASLPVQMYCGDSCPIRLQDSSVHILSIRVDAGNGQGQMEPLPDPYEDTDLRIHAAGGQIAGVESDISVTGWVIPFTPDVLGRDVPRASLLDGC
jgi:hypothetical protein